jgi:hypothetical protein
MRYNQRPPYEILSNRLIDADSMARLARFARFWDLVANSGNFVESTPRLWHERSLFAGFLAFADWFSERTRRTWGIPLVELSEGLFRFLVDVLRQQPQQAAEALWRDYQRGGRPDRPQFLSPYVEPPPRRTLVAQPTRGRRQARHQLS